MEEINYRISLKGTSGETVQFEKKFEGICSQFDLQDSYEFYQLNLQTSQIKNLKLLLEAHNYDLDKIQYNKPLKSTKRSQEIDKTSYLILSSLTEEDIVKLYRAAIYLGIDKISDLCVAYIGCPFNDLSRSINHLGVTSLQEFMKYSNSYYTNKDFRGYLYVPLFEQCEQSYLGFLNNCLQGQRLVNDFNEMKKLTQNIQQDMYIQQIYKHKIKQLFIIYSGMDRLIRFKLKYKNSSRNQLCRIFQQLVSEFLQTYQESNIMNFTQVIENIKIYDEFQREEPELKGVRNNKVRNLLKDKQKKKFLKKNPFLLNM